MRFFFMTLTLILLIPASGFAADEPAVPEGNEPLIGITRGALPDPKEVVPGTPTEAELKEANTVFKSCDMNDRERAYFDCECISLNFLKQRMLDQRDVNDNPTAAPFLIENARKACPNPTAIAGLTYSRCLQWAPPMRSDYEPFCSCYANDFAKRFAFNPTSSLKINQIMMENSMNQCNAGQPVIDQIVRNEQIEMLKKQGTYEQLFPRAKNLNKPIIPADPNAAKKMTLQQRLSGRVSDTNTAPRRTAP